MSSHVYHEIFLHLNWHTKNDQPMLKGDVEEFCHSAIKQKAEFIPGVQLYGIGGTDDHIHIAISIEPSVTISDMVQELKGFSSHEVNRRLERKALEWQRGYGVVSFGRAHLDWVLGYIRDQREHHRCGKTEPRMEAFDRPEPEKPGQIPPLFPKSWPLHPTWCRRPALRANAALVSYQVVSALAAMSRFPAAVITIPTQNSWAGYG